MEEFLDLLNNMSVEAVILAGVTAFLTAFIKIPIKRHAKKRPISSKVTRFIPLIPLTIGGLLAALIYGLKNGKVIFDDEFVELWISVSGLSIAFYSCYENIRDGGRFLFEDKLQIGVCKLLQQTLPQKSLATVKSLTQTISECYYRTQRGGTYDFYAEMQVILKEYLDEETIGAFSKQVEQLWEDMYGRIDTSEEVETVACTATERYEYEIRKKHIVKKTNSDGHEQEKGDGST